MQLGPVTPTGGSVDAICCAPDCARRRRRRGLLRGWGPGGRRKRRRRARPAGRRHPARAARPRAAARPAACRAHRLRRGLHRRHRRRRDPPLRRLLASTTRPRADRPAPHVPVQPGHDRGAGRRHRRAAPTFPAGYRDIAPRACSQASSGTASRSTSPGRRWGSTSTRWFASRPMATLPDPVAGARLRRAGVQPLTASRPSSTGRAVVGPGRAVWRAVPSGLLMACGCCFECSYYAP